MTDLSLTALLEEGLRNPDLHLPVFNRVALDLKAMIDLDQYTSRDLAELIQRDQALTAHILKVSNSAFYAGLRSVKTVQEATVRLGAQPLTSIIHLVTAKTMYKSRIKQFNIWMRDLWAHALGVAIASKWLAQHLGHAAVVEEAFMAGLLHDIGRLIQLRIIDELVAHEDIKTKLSVPLILEISDELHARHGRYYLEQQNMPALYAEVAGRHHDPVVTGDHPVLNLVRLGNKVCQKMGIGITGNPDLLLSTTPEAINLMAKDILLAELQVVLEEQMADLDGVL
jgi:HD-like signal output (HDOD) protein